MTVSDIIQVRPQHLATIRYNAECASLGGRSNIRCKENEILQNREGRAFSTDRQESLYIDQLVGQLGNYALSVYLLGSPVFYFESRLRANRNPWSGDNGYDLPGMQIDVKSSLMRKSKDTMTYNLIVRPKEVHLDWLYVLALVDQIDDPLVYLVGWARELPSICKKGIFCGAHVVAAQGLHSMRNLNGRSTFHREVYLPQKVDSVH